MAPDRSFQVASAGPAQTSICCSRMLSPEIERGETIPRSVVSCLWGICHLGRAWGVHPDGMLRRNHLISDEDVRRLHEWIEKISYAVMLILEGMPATDRHELDYDPPPEWAHCWPTASSE